MLDLNTGKFKPYSKPTNVPLYVHNNSNHPLDIAVDKFAEKVVKNNETVSHLPCKYS